MRKYIKLFLIVFALTSCLLMFVYRQKYSKLNLVFQMMNTFQFKGPEIKCEEQFYRFKKSLKPDWFTEERISGFPLWTEAFTGLYTYSTYWTGQLTRVLALSKNTSLSSLEDMQCILHYEKGSYPKKAILKINVLQKNKSLYLLFIDCKSVFTNVNVPESVSLTTKNPSINVSLAVIQKKFNVVSPAMSMCVKPFLPDKSNTDKIIEFIVYHNYIGVNHFIFFDTGLYSSTKRVLLDFAARNAIFITLLPWNLPTDFVNKFEKIDYIVECLQQTSYRNHSDYLLHMTIDYFLVLKEMDNLKKLSNSLKHDFAMIKLKETKFCLESSNDIFANFLNITFITLLKTKALSNYENFLPVIYNLSEIKKMNNVEKFKNLLPQKTLNKTSVLTESVAAIHSYVKCGKIYGMQNAFFNENKHMWKYKDALFKSDLYRLFQESSQNY